MSRNPVASLNWKYFIKQLCNVLLWIIGTSLNIKLFASVNLQFCLLGLLCQDLVILPFFLQTHSHQTHSTRYSFPLLPVFCSPLLFILAFFFFFLLIHHCSYLFFSSFFSFSSSAPVSSYRPMFVFIPLFHSIFKFPHFDYFFYSLYFSSSSSPFSFSESSLILLFFFPLPNPLQYFLSLSSYVKNRKPFTSSLGKRTLLIP